MNYEVYFFFTKIIIQFKFYLCFTYFFFFSLVGGKENCLRSKGNKKKN